MKKTQRRKAHKRQSSGDTTLSQKINPFSEIMQWNGMAGALRHLKSHAAHQKWWKHNKNQHCSHFVRGIHQLPVVSNHKEPVMLKEFPCLDAVMMITLQSWHLCSQCGPMLADHFVQSHFCPHDCWPCKGISPSIHVLFACKAPSPFSQASFQYQTVPWWDGVKQSSNSTYKTELYLTPIIQTCNQVTLALKGHFHTLIRHSLCYILVGPHSTPQYDPTMASVSRYPNSNIFSIYIIFMA